MHNRKALTRRGLRKVWSIEFLSFEFVSYFDIRISNLVAARGRAREICVPLFIIFFFQSRLSCSTGVDITFAVPESAFAVPEPPSLKLP